MPELPEVETVRRTLVPRVVGERVASVTVRDARLRFPVDPELLTALTVGRKIIGVRRRAKYLLVDFEEGSVLLLHLGMTGRIRFVKHDAPFEKHDHVAWHFSSKIDMRFNDPRRFGMAEAFAKADEDDHPRLAHLGIEPLGDELTAERFAELARGLAKPIKNFLMDGSKVVGVGNIYACEALNIAQISPLKQAGRIGRGHWQKLTAAVRYILSRAIEEGGTTLRDFVDAEGVTGSYATRLLCYGREREKCLTCEKGTIKRIVMAGRSTFYCSACQRR
ncbi:MAG: bifunctional DNA-formamidopyrimidine glycosylase/DNA-(apurinic or apyrimidinic site) lyase [Clostridia bacterium]|nr:bifunctional DNA-formamidopyrimidine glycosylase/DNA-(apurinic or apyrimidinic site) lyase [Deltaproteobacteria bacterium]